MHIFFLPTYINSHYTSFKWSPSSLVHYLHYSSIPQFTFFNSFTSTMCQIISFDFLVLCFLFIIKVIHDKYSISCIVVARILVVYVLFFIKRKYSMKNLKFVWSKVANKSSSKVFLNANTRNEFTTYNLKYDMFHLYIV